MMNRYKGLIAIGILSVFMICGCNGSDTADTTPRMIVSNSIEKIDTIYLRVNNCESSVILTENTLDNMKGVITELRGDETPRNVQVPSIIAEQGVYVVSDGVFSGSYTITAPNASKGIYNFDLSEDCFGEATEVGINFNSIEYTAGVKGVADVDISERCVLFNGVEDDFSLYVGIHDTEVQEKYGLLNMSVKGQVATPQTKVSFVKEEETFVLKAYQGVLKKVDVEYTTVDNKVIRYTLTGVGEIELPDDTCADMVIDNMRE